MERPVRSRLTALAAALALGGAAVAGVVAHAAAGAAKKPTHGQGIAKKKPPKHGAKPKPKSGWG